jgi:hypothetical protein
MVFGFYEKSLFLQRVGFVGAKLTNIGYTKSILKWKGIIRMNEPLKLPNKGGRPSLSLTETLPEVRLTKEEKTMIKLKACLFNGGNVSAYIRRVATEDQREIPPLPSCRCGNKKLKTVFENTTQTVLIHGDVEKVIRILGVPRSFCPECGNTCGNLKLEAGIEEAVDHIVETALHSQQHIPVELSFAGMAGLG